MFNNDMPVPAGCKIAIFDDDLAVTASAKNHDLPKIVDTFESANDTILEYLDSWKVKCNPTKTKAILFTKSPKMLKLRDNFKI
jgi:hypothetical protein